MKTNRLTILAALITVTGINACDNEIMMKTDFESLCIGSGGVVAGDNLCTCGEITCNRGVICNAQNLCAEIETKFCAAGQSKCDSGKFYFCEKTSDNSDIGVWNLRSNDCADFCETGQTKCENKKYYTCNKPENSKPGKWKESKQECPDYTFCNTSMDTCDNDKSTQIGIHKSCFKANGVISNDTNEDTYIAIISTCGGNSCLSDSTECGECRNGDTKCTNDELSQIGIQKECINGKWSEPKNCKSNNGANDFVSCRDEKSCGVCNNNNENIKCSTITNDYAICYKGEWLERRYKCESGCTSDGSGNSTGFCAECQEGTTTCKDGIIKKCIDGKWSKGEKCPTNQCMNNQIECAECNFNESLKTTTCKTLGNQTGEYTCNGGKWQLSKECECKDSTQCFSCNDGQAMCDSTKSYVRCTHHEWGAPEYCQNNEVCATENGEPQCAEQCTDGVVLCTNNTMMKCIDGKWESNGNCEHGCNTDGTSCAVCSAGETKCDVKTVSICVNGNWVEDHTCESKCSLDKTACAECERGTITCANNDDGIGLKTICQNEHYVYKSCENVSCNSKQSECGECKNGAIICEGSSIKTCYEGAWSKTSDCENGFSCTADKTECGKCKNGKTCAQIAGLDVIGRCSNGVPGEAHICSEGESCETTNACKIEIKPRLRFISGAPDGLIVRATPDGAAIGSLNNYTYIETYGMKDGFYRINTADNSAGYILGEYTVDAGDGKDAKKLIEEAEKYLYTPENRCCTYDYGKGKCPPKLENFITDINWTNCKYCLNSVNFLRAILLNLGIEKSFQSGNDPEAFLAQVCETDKAGKPKTLTSLAEARMGDIVWNYATNRMAFVIGPRLTAKGDFVGLSMIGSLDFFDGKNQIDRCQDRVTTSSWSPLNYQRVAYEDSSSILNSTDIKYVCHRKKEVK